jgi:hypothetical protein
MVRVFAAVSSGRLQAYRRLYLAVKRDAPRVRGNDSRQHASGGGRAPIPWQGVPPSSGSDAPVVVISGFPGVVSQLPRRSSSLAVVIGLSSCTSLVSPWSGRGDRHVEESFQGIRDVGPFTDRGMRCRSTKDVITRREASPR